MTQYSSCLICRERIVSKLRRQCRDGDLSKLIDKKLKEEIQTQEENVNPVSENLQFTTTVRILAPEPGELRSEIEKMNAKFDEERKAEEQASIVFLEELKKTGDEDLVLLERLKEDEELARNMQNQTDNLMLKKKKEEPKTWVCKACTFEMDAI